MDDKSQDILDSLPETPPRSRLEPNRELINELRRRGRTYREVARILADHCDIQVSVSTVYRFLSSRARIKSHPQSRHFARLPKRTKGSTALQSKATARTEIAGIEFDQVMQRIAALKSRQEPPSERTRKLFDYDPDQPLHLRKDTGVSRKP